MSELLYLADIGRRVKLEASKAEAESNLKINAKPASTTEEAPTEAKGADGINAICTGCSGRWTRDSQVQHRTEHKGQTTEVMETWDE